ncbi:MAG: hypothetical protein RL625_330 [Gemmatimonadota bacterium]|jgi:prepilin-type N-terminal cleavage/methylation domain-containing protein
MRARSTPRWGALGFTLVELLITLTIFGLVLAAVGRLLVSAQRAYVTQREASAVLGPLRQAEATLSRLLRAAGANPNSVTSVASGRLLPGIYTLTSPAGGFRIVSDFNPANGSFDDEFEDVRTWVANDTLWVSWRNQGGTAAAAQPVAAPVTSVTYSFVNAANASVTPTATTPVAASLVQVTISAPRRVGNATTTVRRQVWIALLNR